MATASVTNTFVAATAAVASEVNTNFTNLVDFANNSTIHRDGSKAFTGNMDAGSNKIVNLTAGTAATDAASVANVTNSIPAGTITMYGGSSAPALWLLCDGSVVSRVTYAALFAAIGTAFNTGGEAGTDFRLPNFQDKYPIGDSGTLTLGATVGSNDAVVVTHNHTQDAHNHTQNSHNHTQNSHTHTATTASSGEHGHNLGNGTVLPYFQGAPGAYGFTVGALNWNNTGPWNGTGASASYSATNAGSHSHTLTTAGTTPTNVAATATNIATAATNQSSGVSGTNANRPQSVVVNYIIRTGV